MSVEEAIERRERICRYYGNTDEMLNLTVRPVFEQRERPHRQCRRWAGSRCYVCGAEAIWPEDVGLLGEDLIVALCEDCR